MNTRLRTFLEQVDRQAWVRFGIGLGGLLLALLSALLSTALRESGRIFLSAAVASFALLSAGLVGLYTVPYLAKRVARERWIDAFEYEVTKEGVIYLAAILVISIAALNTGNNLLFIIISAMLSAVLVSGVASAFILRRLRVHLTLPEMVFAGQPVSCRVRLQNPRRVPLLSLHLHSGDAGQGAWRWRKTVFRVPRGGNRHLELTDWKLQREKAAPQEGARIAPLYFPVIPAQGAVHADVELLFARRGIVRRRALAVSTRFPFSFVKKTRTIASEDEVLVLPRILPLEELLPRLPAITGDFESLLRGHGHDLYRIREEVAGDAARSIDWKASARSGGVMVREFTRDDDRRVCIVFDNPRRSEMSTADYERMIVECASTAWLLHQEGISLEFVMPEEDGTDLVEFLRYLALVDFADEAATRHYFELPEQSFVMVFTAAEWPPATQNGSVLRYGSTQSA